MKLHLIKIIVTERGEGGGVGEGGGRKRDRRGDLLGGLDLVLEWGGVWRDAGERGAVRSIGMDGLELFSEKEKRWLTLANNWEEKGVFPVMMVMMVVMMVIDIHHPQSANQDKTPSHRPDQTNGQPRTGHEKQLSRGPLPAPSYS